MVPANLMHFPSPDDPPIGTLVGRRYQLVAKFYSYGEARYIARDLKAPGQDVELKLGHFNGRSYRFQIKSRFRRGMATHLKRAPAARREAAVSRLTRVKQVLGISQLTGHAVLVEEVA